MGAGRLAALAVVISLASGCAPGRISDLRDAGRLGLGVGPGLSVDARIGDLTHPSLGVASAAAMWGFESRDIEGPWYEARVSDPYATYWLRREGKSWGESLISSGWRGAWESIDWLHALAEVGEPIGAGPLPETGTVVGGELLDGRVEPSRWVATRAAGGDARGWWLRSATDLHVGAHALLVGVRVGFNPMEMVDFLLGLAGLDVAGDDPPAR